MKSILLRPTRLVGIVAVAVLTVALGTLSLFTWLDYKRIDSIRAHVNRTSLLEDSVVVLKDLQLRAETGGAAPAAGDLARVRADLDQIPVRGGPVGTYMRGRLGRLNALLAQAPSQPDVALPAAMTMLDEMLERENRIQLEQLDTMVDYTRLDLRLALAALVGFPCLMVLMLWAVRERVLRPIADLRSFLSRLSEGDFAPVPTERIDPLLLPLFDNYNQLVNRLAQLEQANRQRTSSLEDEVRAATQVLLQQQQSLARSARLAAAGEVSAGLAHELRNPIAGIQVTLANLRRELDDPVLEERMDLVIAELTRVTRLLNALLQQSRHVPETPRAVDVSRLVRDLANLIRYQLPPHVRLATEVPDGLSCRLPEDAVRQGVLNLVLNSVAAIGEAPGQVSIHVWHRDGRLGIEVADDGPGFPEALLAGGVRPFMTSRESGTGLGLAIVRRFAHDMGGEFALANAAPCGARVTLVLPVEREDVRHAVAH
ncbi:MAG TPA: HAMP domain-containing sensor histidine kinase [Burkholderiales bacterium]|nr:HAMP domain-containing sensor histidine kinase [Burkholderiales bacterium]